MSAGVGWTTGTRDVAKSDWLEEVKAQVTSTMCGLEAATWRPEAEPVQTSASLFMVKTVFTSRWILAWTHAWHFILPRGSRFAASSAASKETTLRSRNSELHLLVLR